MSNDILEMLETIRTYFTNDIQNITVCKHRETGEIFILNIIYKKDIFKDVDLNKLLQMKNIKGIIELQEGLCIISKLIDFSSISEYIKNNKISLSREIGYTTFIIDNLVKLKDFPPCILKSLFDLENIVIDKNGNINLLGLIMLNDNYSEISMSQVFNNLAKIFQTIFAGETFFNSDVEKNIPPPINNIINKCLKGEYLSYIDLAKEFKDSKIYRIMNPEVEESQRIYSVRKKLKNKRRKYFFAKTGLLIVLVAIICLPFILRAAKTYKYNSKNIDSNLNNTISEENDHTENKTSNEVYASKNDIQENEEQTGKNIYESNEESLFKFYNEDFLEKCKGETSIGFLDEEKYHKGNCSVRIENMDDSKETFLIGGIDLESIDFRYLNNRDVSLSLWTNSESDIDAMITVQTVQGNSTLARYSKKIYIPKDIWSLQNIDLKSVNGDYLKIYLTTSEKGRVWIDSFEIDILK